MQAEAEARAAAQRETIASERLSHQQVCREREAVTLEEREREASERLSHQQVCRRMLVYSDVC
jgi:hypothetical protein